MDQEVGEFVTQLMNLLNPATTEQASRFVLDLINSDAVRALRLAVTVINQDGTAPFAVKQCLQIIGTVFRPSAQVSQQVLAQRWMRLKLEQRNLIQSACLRGLFQDDPVTRNIAATDLAVIASFDWTGTGVPILEHLTEPFTDVDKFSDGCRVGCFQALKEFVFLKLLRSGQSVAQRNSGLFMPWLAQYLEGITESEGPKAQELVELVKIFRSLFPVFGRFFEEPAKRIRLLEMIMTKLQMPNGNLHAGLYGVLYEIVVMFYKDSLASGNRTMELVFSASIASLQSPCVLCPIAAFEFWARLSDFERQVKDHMNSVDWKKGDLEYQGLVEKTLEQLIPVIFLFLAKIEDDADFEDPNQTNVSVNAAQCLRAMSIVAPKAVFEMVKEKAFGMIHNDDWRVRAGGLTAFWAILKGEERMKRRELFVNGFGDLVGYINDPSPIVTWTALHLMNGILKEFDVVNDLSMTVLLLRTIVGIDKAVLPVKTYTMRLIQTYADRCQMFSNHATLRDYASERVFTNLMDFLTQQLASSEERNDEYSGVLVDTIFKVISCADTQDENIRNQIMGKLGQFAERIVFFGQCLSGVTDRQLALKNMTNYCALITSSALVLKSRLSENEELVGHVLGVVTKCLDMRNEILFDEALISTAALIPCVGPLVQPFMGQITQHLLWAMGLQSPQTMIFASICIFKILSNCPEAFMPVISEFLGLCDRNLNDSNCPVKVKQEIMRNFGAIVRYTGEFGLSKAQEFYDRLKHFSATNLNIEHSGADREIAPRFYETLVYGYHSILLVSGNVGLAEQFCREYRAIANVFTRIAKYSDIITAELIDTIVAYLKDLVRLCAKPLSVYLHQKAVATLLDEACERYRSEDALALRQKISNL